MTSKMNVATTPLTTAGVKPRTKKRILDILTYTALIFFSLLFLFPVFWIIVSSLKPGNELFVWPPSFFPKNPTLNNFRTAFQQGNFSLYIGNSMFVAVTSTLLTVMVNVMSGYAFAKYDFKGSRVIFMFFIATLMIPLEVIMIPIFRVINVLGLYNTFAGVIIPPAATPTGVFIARQFFLTVPNELMESARIDGASESRIFTRIMLPLSKPIISVLAIFSFMWRWNDFMWPLLVLRDNQKFTLQLALQNFNGQYSVDWSSLLSMSVISMIPVLIIFLIFQRQFVEGMVTTGLKD